MAVNIDRLITTTPRRKSPMDMEIEAHLGCLQLNPADRESLLALARLHLSDEATPEQRTLIRTHITGNEDALIAVETLYWDLIDNGIELEAVERLRLGLALIAMSDGQPDPRDARRAIKYLVSRAREADIVAKPHVLEIQATASTQAAPLFDKRWRRDGGRFTRFLWQNIALDVLLGAGVLLSQSLDESLRGGVPLLLLVVFGLAHLSLLLRYIREA